MEAILLGQTVHLFGFVIAKGGFIVKVPILKAAVCEATLLILMQVVTCASYSVLGTLITSKHESGKSVVNTFSYAGILCQFVYCTSINSMWFFCLLS